jgi:predicted amino acid dehydrogenase/ribosome-associated toxin RatA of RatAB toxin-antitoxin module
VEAVMDNRESLQIHISRIISAPRWRVIRQLTRVWEFSTLVPSIKEASIISKTRHTIQTRWHILADGIPIRWVEEDTLELNHNKIYFRALEGDLKEFHGAWQFQDHPQGTLVSVDIRVRVGVPAIEDFAEEHIRALVTRNFELILDALEQRLISRRYAGLKNGDPNKVAGFGLIGHFYNFSHLSRGLRMLNPDFHSPSKEFLSKLFDITPSFKMYEMNDYRSASGEVTNGCIILCTFVPDMVSENIEGVYLKVLRACKLAEKSGVGIVTLGGFTSIVAERLGGRIRQEVDIPVTTGNTYASALAIEGVERAVELLGRDIRGLKVAVVGGTGDIGKACAMALARESRQVTVTGRTGSTLKEVYNALKKLKGKARIEATMNNQKATRDADVVIAAANSSASIMQMDWFKPGAVICDLAYPKNISYTVTRDDVLVFSGGLASVPSPVELSVMMGLPSKNICYGCSCEAMVLALERRFENFSFGRGNITLEKIEEIKGMARKHGFSLAPFFWADKIIDAAMIERVKRSIKHG